MLELQEMGCHNINFVSPSHVVPQILEALPIAIRGGLKVPLIYNTGGYDSVETLRMLDGIFDIYLPDLKFMERDVSQKLCEADDYPERVMEGIREMHRQVGDLKMNRLGIAERGLLVRHLVMPGGLAGTRKAMRFLSREISPETYVNIMAQFHPCGLAKNLPPLNRRITEDEFEEALQIAGEEGIHRLDQRTGAKGYRFL
jgi:putative pyruvate formate lyase activating enzyme